MKEKVFALIANVAVLEAEEESEPIEEVHVRLPLRWTAEIADCAEGGECGANFGETEGRVVGVEVVVEWDDVVRLVFVVVVSGWHIIGIWEESVEVRILLLNAGLVSYTVTLYSYRERERKVVLCWKR
jgi:hypothetical protein